MKKIEEPGTVIYYDGKLTKVIAIAEGKTIIMEEINQRECDLCGKKHQISVLESSPLFQKNSLPVKTLTE